MAEVMRDEYIAKMIASGPEQVGQVAYDMAVEIKRLRGALAELRPMLDSLMQPMRPPWSATENYWFPDVVTDMDSTDSDTRVKWQPFLQIGGSCLPIEAWFDSKEACEQFIRREIVGAGIEE